MKILKNGNNLPLLSNVPSIDLHGETRETARILVNEFIDDAIRLKEEKIVIIHGIGTGVLKKEVHNLLQHSKKIKRYYVDFFNVGCTIVELNKND